MTYPAAVSSYTTKTAKVDLYKAADVNAMQTDIVNIQTELGTDPAGSCTDLKTRLAVSLALTGAIACGTAFPTSPAPIDGQPFYRTDEDTFYIYDEADWEAVTSNLSNVLFQWHGTCRYIADASETGSGIRQAAGVDVTEDGAFLNMYLGGKGTTYLTVIDTKWKKIAGVNTITYYAYVQSSDNNYDAYVNVDVGGAAGAIATTANPATKQWITTTIDVSGLDNGTVYDVIIQLKNELAACTTGLFDFIAFGS